MERLPGQRIAHFPGSSAFNSRLDAPAGLHITLFEELESDETREATDGFGTDESRRG